MLETLRKSVTGTVIVTAIVRYRRYGDYRPYYRPYYGYRLDRETYAVWRNLRPTWFDY